MCVDQHGGITSSSTKTINLHIAPTVEMITPASLTFLPETNIFSFVASDDSSLISSNCVAVINGLQTLNTITITSGSGTTLISGSYSVILSETGSYTLATKVTDVHNVITTSDPLTINVIQPTVTLEYPLNSASYDIQPIALGGLCIPAVSGNMSFYDNETLIQAVPMSTGAAATTVQVPTIGIHNYTSRVTTLAGTVVSPIAVVTIADVLPVISNVSPANAGTVLAGILSVSATVTHAKSRPMLARFRVDSGSWISLTFVGDVASGVSVDQYLTEIQRTLTIQATDALDWNDAGAITVSSTTFTPSYAIPWNNGSLTMTAAYQSVTAPSSGALQINLSNAITNAINGAILKIIVPAGPTSLGLNIGAVSYTHLTLPTIYSV